MYHTCNIKNISADAHPELFQYCFPIQHIIIVEQKVPRPRAAFTVLISHFRNLTMHVHVSVHVHVF